MRKKMAVLSPYLVIVAVGVWGLTGCLSERNGRVPLAIRREAAVTDLPAAPPMAHGGTHTVNDAAFDAMFFKHYGVNPFVDADEDNLSTFAVDVDTGSYSVTRSYLDRGHLPPGEAVRVEEFVNALDYRYRPPESATEAFAIRLAAAPSRFGKGKLLLRVGLKARQVERADRRPAALTLVVDTSGSMRVENRIGLVKRSVRLLVDALREDDTIGIVEYGSRARTVLEPTSLRRREKILKAIDSLEADGATNAEEGLSLGYRMAEGGIRKDERPTIHRVILFSDGVANVGRTGPDSILETIRASVDRGIVLTTVGVGMGNYNDVLMERLADQGNGQYVYIDTIDEARRVFVDQLVGTIETVARDVKVQVEFNESVVRSYRLLGYENRDVADKDFRDDRVDGGEIGAGHAVTALYELKLWPDRSGRLATVRVRHKTADGSETMEVSRELATDAASADFARAEPSLRLAACVAEFAEILRKSHWARGSSLGDVLTVARSVARDGDNTEPVDELIEMIKKARRLGADKAADLAHRDE